VILLQLPFDLSKKKKKKKKTPFDLDAALNEDGTTETTPSQTAEAEDTPAAPEEGKVLIF
jgi:hypothetical protein